MRKTYGDGSAVEGTPEEIRAYEERRGATVIPMMPGTMPAVGTGPSDVLIPIRSRECLIAAFFRDHPDVTSCSIFCSCPSCTPMCGVN